MKGGAHTCFPHKHLLRRAGGPLTRSVVDTHADLVALVFTQLCDKQTEGKSYQPNIPSEWQFFTFLELFMDNTDVFLQSVLPGAFIY